MSRNEADLRKRLKNACSRALYWSGNPSFTGHRFRPNARRLIGGHHEQYELALCDIDSLCRELESLTGRVMRRYDPRAAFIARYLAGTINRDHSLPPVRCHACSGAGTSASQPHGAEHDWLSNLADGEGRAS